MLLAWRLSVKPGRRNPSLTCQRARVLCPRSQRCTAADRIVGLVAEMLLCVSNSQVVCPSPGQLLRRGTPTELGCLSAFRSVVLLRSWQNADRAWPRCCCCRAAPTEGAPAARGGHAVAGAAAILGRRHHEPVSSLYLLLQVRDTSCIPLNSVSAPVMFSVWHVPGLRKAKACLHRSCARHLRGHGGGAAVL